MTYFVVISPAESNIHADACDVYVANNENSDVIDSALNMPSYASCQVWAKHLISTLEI